MIHTISYYLTGKIQKEGLIQPYEFDYYCYGIEITISNFIDITIALLIGLLFSELPGMLLFLSIFIGLRFFTGGYHAHSYASCFIVFTITCTMAMILMAKNLPHVDELVIGLAFLSSPALFFAPVPNTNHPLSEKKTKLFHHLSLFIGACILIISATLYLKDYKGICRSISIALTIVNLFILIEKRRKNHEENHS